MSNPQKPLVELALRNDPAQLVLVTNALDRLGRDGAIPESAVIELQVALDEVLSNIIKYAWPEGGEHELQVRIGSRQGEVEAVIIDDGLAFDPREPSAAGAPVSSSASRAGGIGLKMLKQLVDRIEYS